MKEDEVDHQEVWSELERIFNMDPRVRYSSDDVDRLHRRCVREVENMSRGEIRRSLSRYVRDTMLSEESLAQDKGWEEVLSFLDWVDGGME
jgi:t-SNARE complex subunit (syntaxin)